MPIFFSLFIVFAVWLSYEIKKSDKLGAKYKEEFLAREHEANFTRKQSTDNLPRITMPDSLVFHPGDERFSYIEGKLKDTFTHEIINLTGYTNTDLKLEYGRANLDYLSECDGFFTRLVGQLATWIKLLNENELHNDCKQVLDFAISIHADNTDFFTMRANYYIEDNETDKINDLIQIAQTLNTIKKDIIINKLNDILVDSIT